MSIPTRLVGIFMIGTLVLITILSFYNNFIVRHSFENETYKEMEILGDIFQTKTRERQTALENLVKSTAQFFEYYQKDVDTILLKSIVKNNKKDLFGIGWSSMDSDNPFCHYMYWKNNAISSLNLANDSSYNYLQKHWMRKPMLSNSPGWSGYFWDNGAGDILMSTYAWPIKDKEGKVRSLLFGDLSLDFIEQDLKRFSSQMHNKKIVISNRNTGEVVLPDQDFHCAVANKAAGLAKNVVTKSIQQFYIGDKKYYLYTFPNEKQNWSVNVVFSNTIVQDKLAKVNRVTACITIIAVGMIIVMLLVILETIRKPLKNLSLYIKDLNFSRYNLPVPYLSYHDEIGNIANSFAVFKTNIYKEFQTIIDAHANQHQQQYEQKMAEQIRGRLLPSPLTLNAEGWHAQAAGAQFYRKNDLGGDYFDFFIVDNRYLVLYIAEIATIGIEVALFMGRLRTFIRTKYIEPDVVTPEFILSQLNNFWCEKNEKCIYVNLHLSVIDLKLGIHNHCSAGFNSNMIANSESGFQMSEQSTIAIGMVYDEKYFSEINNLPDDFTLLLYTNGALQENQSDNKETLLSLYSHLQKYEGIAELDKNVKEFFPQSKCIDELTFLALRLKKM